MEIRNVRKAIMLADKSKGLRNPGTYWKSFQAPCFLTDGTMNLFYCKVLPFQRLFSEISLVYDVKNQF